jgi:glycosyltransferase involved in cell wall biosynthesis
MRQAHKKQLWFAYSTPLSFSGQAAATELIIQELTKKGWDCRLLLFPAFNRAITNRFLRYAHYGSRLLVAWLRFFKLLFVREPVVHLIIGQSISSFIVVGLPYAIFSTLRPTGKGVISLHGNVFTTWTAQQREARIFVKLLRQAYYVTVLGAKHQQKLVALGIPEEKILIVPNTCELHALGLEAVMAKQHRLEDDPEAPIQVLHLSTLIESKGYPEFLEALELLAQRPLSRPIRAILCGPMAFSPYCKRFTNEATKAAWIRSKVERINASAQVTVEWIPGARGEQKRKLFLDAHVFVFPSRYPVEAQPLVLLEAMASGCAIISTDVGEISSMLDDQSTIQLEDTAPQVIAKAIIYLMQNPEKRLRLTVEGQKRFDGKFRMEHYAHTWEHIFSTLLT